MVIGMERVLDERDRRELKKLFENEMKEAVITLQIRHSNCEYCDFLDALMRELSEISGSKIKYNSVEMTDFHAKLLGVDRGPVLLIGDKGEVRYTGAPLGEEGWAFIRTLVIASNKKHGLDKYEDNLRSLDRVVRIETVVTPQCPYCPYAVLLANRIAIASGGRVISDTVDAYEFPEIANKFMITAVPTIILSVEKPYSGQIFSVGLPHEKFIIKRILELGNSD